MIEDELRAAFARQESNIPELGALRQAIDRAAVRRRRKLRSLSATAAVAVVAVVLIVSAPLTIGRSRLEPLPLIASLSPSGPPIVATGAVNVLLTGASQVRETGVAMLVHIPPEGGRLYLLNLPGDLRVTPPGGAETTLNAVVLMDGPDPITDQVVSRLTGVTSDATSSILAVTFAYMVDDVGKVRACLPQDLPPGRGPNHVYPKGCADFDSNDAVEIVISPGGHALILGFMRRAAELDRGEIGMLLFGEGQGKRVDTKGHDRAALAARASGLKSTEVIGLAPPAGTTTAGMAEVFAALRQGRLDAFTVAHPDWATPVS